MSIETTLANAAARDADGVWQAHRKSCATCSPAARKRQWDLLCFDGRGMKEIRDDLRKAAAHEKWLDEQPNPDQGGLFEIGEEW